MTSSPPSDPSLPDDVASDQVTTDEPTTVDPPVARGSLSIWMALGLAAACAFLAGAVVHLWSETDEPSASSVEVGFYQDMISHHEQAVQMALLELANGSSPVVRSFAQEIVTFQQYEIGRMDQSLRDWGHDRSRRPATAMGWMGQPVPVGEMPGLATEEQMQALSDARGAEADALFLAMMAAHHDGGVHMASAAAEDAGDPGVQRLAAIMARNQSVEINEYRRVAEREGLPVDIEAYEPAPDPGDDAEHGH